MYVRKLDQRSVNVDLTLCACLKRGRTLSVPGRPTNLDGAYYACKWWGKRGAVVEWLERLGYGAESRRKVVNSRLGFAIRLLENSLCQPSNKWETFSDQGKNKTAKEAG